MDYNYIDEDKTQRIRAIIITVAFSIIVLGIATWAIIAIVGSRNTDENIVTANEAVAAVDEGKTEAVSEKTEEQTAPATEGVTKTTEPAKVATTNNVSAKAAVPETGPEELLPLAMVLGMGTAFAFSRKMAKNQA